MQADPEAVDPGPTHLPAPPIKNTDDCGCTDDGNQHTRQALVVLEQHDHRQGTGADRKRRPIRPSVQDLFPESP